MEIKYSKTTIKELLEYRSLKSVYRLIHLSKLPLKTSYTREEVERLKITKSLIKQRVKQKQILEYWSFYYGLKDVKGTGNREQLVNL